MLSPDAGDVPPTFIRRPDPASTLLLASIIAGFPEKGVAKVRTHKGLRR
jgi:hypothetical protein